MATWLQHARDVASMNIYTLLEEDVRVCLCLLVFIGVYCYHI
jgi:hypothetical protein